MSDWTEPEEVLSKFLWRRRVALACIAEAIEDLSPFHEMPGVQDWTLSKIGKIKWSSLLSALQ